MDYKHELKKMKKHRRLYHPAMKRMLALHRKMRDSSRNADISDFDEMIIVLELITVGYLDEDAFIISRRFGDITGLAYKGMYPFTEAGERMFRSGGSGIGLGSLAGWIRGIFSKGRE